MTKKNHSRSERIFRALLRLFPFDFRWKHGREMEQMFRQRRKEEEHQGGTMGKLKLWWQTLADIVRTAPREHLEMLAQDAGYALRLMRKNLGFTTVAVLTLALGIGANTAIFSVMNGVLLRPLPYPDSENLMMVWETNLEKGWTQSSVTLPNFADWRLRSRVFESMAAYSSLSVTLTGGDRPERITSANVTHEFFSTLGVDPVLGREFLPEEDRPGSRTVAILSYGLWQRRTAGDSNVVGKKLILNNNPYTVVGVMPGGFDFPAGTELWTPLAADPSTAGRRTQFLSVVARLKPGVTRSQAKSDMDNLAAQLAKDYPNENGGWGASVVPLLEQTVGNARTPLLVLMGAVGFVLLIACANVANLLLARSSSREKELAVRRALGAGRVRLVRQLLTESLLLALLGGAAGVATALGGLRWLLVVRPANLPRLDTITLDYFALGFTLSITLLTGILFGLLPALQASRGDLALSLKEGGRSSNASAGNHVRSALVVAEVALAVVLLVGAGLLIRSFGELVQVDPGFKTEGILTFRISLPSARPPDEATAASFYQNFLNEIRTLPGVERASAISHVPVGDGSSSLAIAEGDDPFLHPDGSFISALHRQVDPDYHRIMGISPVRGRLLSPSDTADSIPVVLINQTMARRYWPGENPLASLFA